jgi:hypothetical protein
MESWSRSALYEVARAGRKPLGEPPGTFFLTLCAVAAPVSLPEPKSPNLQRFRFFFTKQQEHSVERCWLHFGYFRTVEEARKWREVLCRVYPAAVIRTVPPNSASATSNNLTDSQVLALLSKSPADASKAAARPASGPERRQPTLEDTLNELRDSALGAFDSDTDEVSRTGVRHLRVEVQQSRAAQAKSRKALRRI